MNGYSVVADPELLSGRSSTDSAICAGQRPCSGAHNRAQNNGRASARENHHVRHVRHVRLSRTGAGGGGYSGASQHDEAGRAVDTGEREAPAAFSPTTLFRSGRPVDRRGDRHFPPERSSDAPCTSLGDLGLLRPSRSCTAGRPCGDDNCLGGRPASTFAEALVHLGPWFEGRLGVVVFAWTWSLGNVLLPIGAALVLWHVRSLGRRHAGEDPPELPFARGSRSQPFNRLRTDRPR